MTSSELKTQIDSDITDKVANDSVTPTNVGGNMKDIVDFSVEKIYIAKITQVGSGGITETVIKNTLPDGVTVTYPVQSTGTYGISPSDLGNYECQVSNTSLVKTVKAPMNFSGFSGVLKQTDLSGALVDDFTDIYVRLKRI